MNNYKLTKSTRTFRLALAGLLALCQAGKTLAAPKESMPPVAPAPVYDPKVPPNFEEAKQAMSLFQMPDGFKVKVWAAEPQLINPVAMSIDTRGRIWIAETNRFRQGGVLDIRHIYSWLEEDMACRTVEDRIAMVKRHWPDSLKEMTKNPERVRMLEDSSGGGVADHAVVFADGFNDLADGIASGVLERKGNIYFTNIPNLWMLKDTKGDGVATERKILSTGYGTRYSFEGHDLHGLRFGPDGKLYFSCGDRGFNVTTREGKKLEYPDTGGVLRCDADGSNLEVFAHGLRNPQKLCFDDHGNLFTGDNNSDNGDPAKWYYVVEGADCGWRVGYQHIKKPRATGALLMEGVMALEKDSNQLSLTPPIQHIGNGPSGCNFYPGTGMPDSFKDHFFLCDFRGGPTNSGLWSFVMKPNGARFEMAEPNLPKGTATAAPDAATTGHGGVAIENKKPSVKDERTRFTDRMHLFWGVLATDAEFGTDGGIYVSDWTNGWERPNKGRIYRFVHEASVKNPLVAQTQMLLKEGMEKRDDQTLIALLSHADQRVRQEAQFELADRGAKVATLLQAAAKSPAKDSKYDASRPELARLHAIWCLGQIGRKDSSVFLPVVDLMNDADAEVRAQVAKTAGELHLADAQNDLIKLVGDGSTPRVQFFAAIALGKLGNDASVDGLFKLLASNGDKDAFVRHAAVTGLSGLKNGAAEAAKRLTDANVSVRIGAVEVLRRLKDARIAPALNDADPMVVLEAARAINDMPIDGAQGDLAKMISHAAVGTAKTAQPILRRALNANYRIGKLENAQAIVQMIADEKAPDEIRAEAIELMLTWSNPSPRDYIVGDFRPLAQKSRDGTVANNVLRPVLGVLAKNGSIDLRVAALTAAESVGLEPMGVAMEIVQDQKVASEVRGAALKVLAAQKSPQLSDALKMCLIQKTSATLRREAIKLQSTQPDAAARLDEILLTAPPADQQSVFVALTQVGGNATDVILNKWMDQLQAGKVSPMVQLDLLNAASRSKADYIAAKLQRYEDSRKKDDTLANWRECLEGGDVTEGKKVFFEKQEVGCMRCHMIGKEGGGNVGPNLIDLGKRQSREYILESMMLPNAKIAPGFESAGIKLNNGEFMVGVVKNETETSLDLDTGAEKGIVKIQKTDIKNRKPAPSPMPEDIGKPLTKNEIRDLVEYLVSQKG